MRERPGLWRAVRPRAAWVAGVLATAVVLFWCYLRESQTTPVNSDGAGMVLQGWDMLHGNLLLSGWWLADVTFYTFEIPIDALVAWIHGLDSDVVHITAAVVYTLVVLTGALLAKGKARGAEGVTRALLGAGIMVAPCVNPGARILLLSPDHIGTAVPVLLTLLLVDRARPRAWVPVAVCVLLVWAQLNDPLASYVAAAPIGLVCLVRALLRIAGVRRRPRWGARLRWPGWYDAGLAAAAALSVVAANASVAAIKAAGGYSMLSLSGVAKRVPSSEWGAQIHATSVNLLILFGADFYEQPNGTLKTIAFLHFAGLALAAVGLVIGIVGLLRRADRVNQILTIGIGANLVAGTFGTQAMPIGTAHEIAVVLPFGAVLAGRTIGPWLARRRWPRITVRPVLGVAFACYLAALGYSTSLPPKGAPQLGLADFLLAHHLTSGLGQYWSANSTTLASGGRVRVASVHNSGRIPYTWVTKPEWFQASHSYANFILATPGRTGNEYQFSEDLVAGYFGKPAHEYVYGTWVIMVWNRNILLKVQPPVQTPIEG